MWYGHRGGSLESISIECAKIARNPVPQAFTGVGWYEIRLAKKVETIQNGSDWQEPPWSTPVGGDVLVTVRRVCTFVFQLLFASRRVHLMPGFTFVSRGKPQIIFIAGLGRLYAGQSHIHHSQAF